jgi:hypothetical protein
MRTVEPPSAGVWRVGGARCGVQPGQPEGVAERGGGSAGGLVGARGAQPARGVGEQCIVADSLMAV